MKRIGAAAAMAAMTIAVAALSGVALADGSKPDKPAPPPKAAIHEQSKPAKPATPESASKPSEPEAKVYICHATGSSSNPYVLIHVSSHALPAHTRHQDGRDIVLGASPGTCPGASTSSNVKAAEHSESAAGPKVKESEENEANEASETSEAAEHSQSASAQKVKESEENEASETSEENESGNSKVFICHATGSASNPFVLIHVSEHAVPAHTRHQDGRDIVLGSTAGPCPPVSSSSQTSLSAVSIASNTSSSNTAASTSNTSATSSSTSATSNAASTPSAEAGVLGAVKALSAPKAAKPHAAKANAGVLGTLAALSTGTLPFSGLRLWIVELVALGLIGLGVATRLVVRRRPN